MNNDPIGLHVILPVAGILLFFIYAIALAAFGLLVEWFLATVAGVILPPIVRKLFVVLYALIVIYFAWRMVFVPWVWPL